MFTSCCAALATPAIAQWHASTSSLLDAQLLTSLVDICISFDALLGTVIGKVIGWKVHLGRMCDIHLSLPFWQWVISVHLMAIKERPQVKRCSITYSPVQKIF